MVVAHSWSNVESRAASGMRMKGILKQKYRKDEMKKNLMVLGAAATMLFSANVFADAAADYTSVCNSCHMPAVAAGLNAPAFGDKAAWAPRIAKGVDALYSSAITGVPGTAMLPKGSSSYSDDQLKAVVDYMVSKAQ